MFQQSFVLPVMILSADGFFPESKVSDNCRKVGSGVEVTGNCEEVNIVMGVPQCHI